MVYKTEILAKFNAAGKVIGSYFECPRCKTSLAKVAPMAEIKTTSDVIFCAECGKKFMFPHTEPNRYGSNVTIMEVEI